MRWRPTASTSIWSASRARRCRARSPTSRASPFTGIATPRLKIRGELTGSTYAVAGLFDAMRISFRLWRTLRTAAAARSGPRAEPAGVSDPGGDAGSRCSAAASGSSSTGTTSATRCCSCGSGSGIRRCGWRAGSSGATRVASTRNLCVSRGLAAFLESRFGVKQAHGALRPAGLGVHADRARRARALPPGAVHAPRHPRQHRRLHRLSDELDRGRGLRRRHRSRDAARGADPRVGGGQQLAPLPGAGDPGDRRRRPPRRVRAALRRPAGAPRFSCARACSSRTTTRASSAAPISGCACTGRRPASTSR